jgi:hypothetical protein
VLLLIVGAVGVIIGRSIAPPRPPPTRQQVETDLGMDRTVAAVDFRETPFDEAVDLVRKQTSANIVVKWRELEAAGIDSKAPVTLRLTNLPLKRVLRFLCDEMGSGTVVVNARAAGGAIQISSAEGNVQTETRLYDVQDIVRGHYQFLQRLGWQPSTQPSDGDGDGGQSLFAAVSSSGEPARPYDEAIEEITRMITDFVEPDMWRDAGGTVGSIREFDGRLMITATPDMHDDIAALLELLRKGK